MKQTRHIPDQIILKLKTFEQRIVQGRILVDFSRALEVSQPTFHRLRQVDDGM